MGLTHTVVIKIFLEKSRQLYGKKEFVFFFDCEMVLFFYFFYFFFKFYFIFKLYIIVLVLPNIKMDFGVIGTHMTIEFPSGVILGQRNCFISSNSKVVIIPYNVQ